MNCDYVCFVTFDLFQLPITICDVAMRCSVEAIAPNSITAIELIRNGVEISRLGQRLMECSIKNCDLRQTTSKNIPGCVNSLNVGGIVERRQFDAIFNRPQHQLVNFD